MSDSKSMQAVVFHGPRNISLQERPIPKIQNEADIIVKVDVTALCGSELHVYRGHQASQTGFIMGHEFAGTVVEAGSEVETFRVGDKVVVPFTVSCGNCFYCRNGGSARCPECLLFGTAFLDGGQAEYVRVPLADTTAIVAPATIADEALVLMADIFPTGYYAVKSGMEMLTGMAVRDSTIVVVGSGPVGLCAIVAAANLRPQRLLAIDSVKDRLGRAEKLGAKPLNLLDGMANLQAQVEAVTEGRGADLVIEAVGLSPALRTAFEIVRPFGVISSIGVHSQDLSHCY
ncbi:putative zinc-type alcohol dehydrogenase-like protein YbdR [Colletotrichum fructicola]|nr:putative zinc-type alcohol dehydrogenase-like protein YbdR [Colletotrichum fructicola]KAF4899081.1 putative zinc-type alcohol dehydrogenase-like protein YbdR [Colletotrichum fructicola]